VRRRLIIAGAGAVAGLAGCHASPQIDVARIDPPRQTADGYELPFELEATNRNPFELPLLTVSYELWLEGERVFEGRRSGEATLRREGTQSLSLPVAVALAPGEAPPAGVTPYRLRGTVRYHTPGALARSLFDARLSRPSTSFDVRGEIDFGAGETGQPGAAGAGAGSAGGG
jgi:hypothetical protein